MVASVDTSVPAILSAAEGSNPEHTIYAKKENKLQLRRGKNNLCSLIFTIFANKF